MSNDVEVLTADQLVDTGESSRLQFKLKDDTGTVLNFTDPILLSLHLTRTEKSTGSVINNRENQSILNGNGGTVEADGTVTMRFTAADSAMVTQCPKEEHLVKFTWSWLDDQFNLQHGHHFFIIEVVDRTRET